MKTTNKRNDFFFCFWQRKAPNVVFCWTIEHFENSYWIQPRLRFRKSAGWCTTHISDFSQGLQICSHDSISSLLAVKSWVRKYYFILSPKRGKEWGLLFFPACTVTQRCLKEITTLLRLEDFPLICVAQNFCPRGQGRSATPGLAEHQDHAGHNFGPKT